MPRPKPVLDVLTINFTEALGIYLYAHRRLDDPRAVGSAHIERPANATDEQGYAMGASAFLVYRGRGADDETKRLDISASPDAFAFELQQTLARYAAGLVDEEIHGVDYDDR